MKSDTNSLDAPGSAAVEERSPKGRSAARWVSGLVATAAAVTAVVATAAPASASTDDGYFRIERSDFWNLSAVGRIPESALTTANNANGGAKDIANGACSAYVGSKAPGSWIGGAIASWAVQPLCSSIVDQAFGDSPEVEGGICFTIPLENIFGVRAGWC